MTHSNWRIVQVNPADSIRMGKFVSMSVDYIRQHWPRAFGNKNTAQARHDYHLELLDRIKEGPRGLFLIDSTTQRNFAEPVALAHAYVSDDTLYIAEFYVSERYRRQGLARMMLNHIKNWSLQYDVQTIQIEVDKELPLANHFWGSFNFQLDSTGERNIYSKNLRSEIQKKL